MTDIPNLPIVPLRGSEGWQHAYDWGRLLDFHFPNQDADDFAYACTENVSGPAADRTITELVMEQQGDRDGPDWVWRVTFDDNSVWVATGGCDYTGWDCQSWLTWTQENG